MEGMNLECLRGVKRNFLVSFEWVYVSVLGTHRQRCMNPLQRLGNRKPTKNIPAIDVQGAPRYPHHDRRTLVISSRKSREIGDFEGIQDFRDAEKVTA